MARPKTARRSKRKKAAKSGARAVKKKNKGKKKASGKPATPPATTAGTVVSIKDIVSELTEKSPGELADQNEDDGKAEDSTRLVELESYADELGKAVKQVGDTESKYLDLKERTKQAKKANDSALDALVTVVKRFRGDTAPNLFNPPGEKTSLTVIDDPTVPYEPEAWKDTSIGDLDISDGLVTKLAGTAKIATLGELSAYMADKQLTDIKGVGEKAGTKVEDAMQKWFAANPALCPPPKSAGVEPKEPAPKTKPGDPDHKGDDSTDPEAWRDVGVDILRTHKGIEKADRISDNQAARLVAAEITTIGALADAIAGDELKEIKRMGLIAIQKIHRVYQDYAKLCIGSCTQIMDGAYSTQTSEERQADGVDGSAAEEPSPPETETGGEQQPAREIPLVDLEYDADDLEEALICRPKGACSTPFEIDGRLWVTLDYNDALTRFELVEVRKPLPDPPADAEMLTDNLLDDSYELLEKSRIVILA